MSEKAPQTLPGFGGATRAAIGAAALLLIGVALALTFLGDTFVVRTGSMEPTLVASSGGGDRVVVSAIHSRSGAPRRFDLIAFRYPNNRAVTYLKRVCGLGGEQLLIAGGELWLLDPSFPGELAEGLASGRAAILRKPEAVTDALLPSFPVFCEEELDPESVLGRHFGATNPSAGGFAVEAGRLVVRAGEETLLRTRAPILDAVRDLGAGLSVPPLLPGSGLEPAGDLSLRLEVTPRDAAGIVILELCGARGAPVARAEIAVRGSGARTRILSGGRELGSSPLRLEPGKSESIRFDNVDDRLRLIVGGDAILSRDVASPAPAEKEGEAALPASAAFGAAGGGFDLRPVALLRDVHWRAAGQRRFLIPPGHYVVLGDHSAQSSDSRYWRRVAIEDLRTGEILEGDESGVTSGELYLHDGNPWTEIDGSRRFVDHRGRFRDFPDARHYRVLSTWPTPYVPEDTITGRGILVIAPPGRIRWLR